MRTCRLCGRTTKDTPFLYKLRSGVPRIQNICKTCHAEERAEYWQTYYKLNKKRILSVQAKYFEANKLKIRKRCAEHRRFMKNKTRYREEYCET